MNGQMALTPLKLSPPLKGDMKALVAKVAATPGPDQKVAARKAAEEFEASFLTTMLEQMWTGIEADAPFGGGHAEKVYRSMMVGEYAKSLSAAGGIGLADHVYREMLNAQEGNLK